MSARRSASLLAAAAVAALSLGAAARAANPPDARLDAAATGVAGHPVRVYCETDPAGWGPGDAAAGYTWPPHLNPPEPWMRDTIFVNPWTWAGLHAALDRTATTFAAASSIHVLAHESFHQRDGIYASYQAGDAYPNSFEGRTDCAALAADEGVAIGFFGYPATVERTDNEFRGVRTSRVVYRYVRRRVHSHWKRVRVKRRVTEVELVATPVVTTVRNPELDLMHTIQQAYHNSSNARNPAYAGDCTT